MSTDEIPFEHTENITRSTGKTEKGVPYTELKLQFFLGYPIDITFRAYTKNVWIAYNDDRFNQSNGADLLDCWLAPTIIYKKVPIQQFDLEKYLFELIEFFGYELFFYEDEVQYILSNAKAIKESQLTNHDDSV